MGILWAKEVFAERSQHKLADGLVEYAGSWLVRVDDIRTSPQEVASAAGLPDVFDPWLTEGGDTDSDVRLQSRDIKQDPENPFIYRVALKYTTDLGDSCFGDRNPLLRCATFEYGFSPHTKIAVKALDDFDDFTVDVVNSAFDRFDPPPEVEDARQVVTVNRNEAVDGNGRWANRALAVSYQGKVNADAWDGYAIGTLRMANIRAREQFENGVHYYAVTYEIHAREEGWAVELADQGFRQLGPGAFERTVCKDGKGHPVMQPAPLDGFGQQLASGLPLVYLTPFRFYKKATFATLGLV